MLTMKSVLLQSTKKDKEGNPVLRDWAAEEERIAAKEEENLVEEFATRLSHNIGMVRFYLLWSVHSAIGT